MHFEAVYPVEITYSAGIWIRSDDRLKKYSGRSDYGDGQEWDEGEQSVFFGKKIIMAMR